MGRAENGEQRERRAASSDDFLGPAKTLCCAVQRHRNDRIVDFLSARVTSYCEKSALTWHRIVALRTSRRWSLNERLFKLIKKNVR